MKKKKSLVKRNHLEYITVGTEINEKGKGD